jgi:hypothetical protein
MLNKALLSAAALATLFTANASAQEPAAGGAPKAPWVVACAADMTKHCDAEMKANGDVRPCLAKHEADLSQQCKDIFLRKYRIVEMCKDDIEKVCAGAQGKDLGKCFNEKQAQLSEKCKTALRQGSKEQKKQEAAKAAPAAAAVAEAPAKPAKPAKAAKAAKPAK